MKRKFQADFYSLSSLSQEEHNHEHDGKPLHFSDMPVYFIVCSKEDTD